MIKKVHQAVKLLSPKGDGGEPSLSMIETARKVVSILSPAERRHAYVLLGMILIMALLQVVGIASIMPFMAILANPEVVETNSFLNSAYTALGFTSIDRFLFFMGVAVFVVFLVSVVVKGATNWAILNFTAMRGYSIARRLVAGYLARPYDWFLNRHSAELGKAALSEVHTVVEKGLLPLMQMLAHGAVVVAILALLVAADPTLAMLVGGNCRRRLWPVLFDLS